MSCITKGNIRCTKCCEAIHISKEQYLKFARQPIEELDGDPAFIMKWWTPISKRRAKKINPYIFERVRKSTKEQYKYINHGMQYFTCKALVKDFGCSIRGTDEHPHVCKSFGSDTLTENQNCYSPTCTEDINIIARSM